MLRGILLLVIVALNSAAYADDARKRAAVALSERFHCNEKAIRELAEQSGDVDTLAQQALNRCKVLEGVLEATMDARQIEELDAALLRSNAAFLTAERSRRDYENGWPTRPFGCASCGMKRITNEPLWRPY